jgi:hypothetical protein
MSNARAEHGMQKVMVSECIYAKEEMNGRLQVNCTTRVTRPFPPTLFLFMIVYNLSMHANLTI